MWQKRAAAENPRESRLNLKCSCTQFMACCTSVATTIKPTARTARCIAWKTICSPSWDWDRPSTEPPTQQVRAQTAAAGTLALSPIPKDEPYPTHPAGVGADEHLADHLPHRRVGAAVAVFRDA